MSRTVLFVDDDIETLELIRDRFELEGVRALLAGSLLEGLELLEKHHREIALVVVDGDLREPNLPAPHSGPIVTRARELGISSLSHTGSEESARILAELGTVGHVPKGADSQRLIKSVLARLSQLDANAG